MHTLKASILSLGLIAGFATTASAQITFDDASTAPYFTLTDGYSGFNWSNTSVIDPNAWFLNTTKGGFVTPLTSGTYVALNNGSAAMSLSRNSSFNLTGGTFAAAWRNGLNINAKGYAGGTELYNKTFTVSWDVAQYLNFDFFGVDNVVFASSGGTVDPMYYYDSNQSFAFDNLDVSEGSFERAAVIGADVAVVPEPMTMSLVAAGLLAMAGVQARRRRTATRTTA